MLRISKKYELLQKIEDHQRKGTRKLNQNILTVTDVFLNQKRVNVSENMTKMASLESFLMVPLGASVTIKIFQLSFRVPFLRRSLQFLVKVFPFLSLILHYYTQVNLSRKLLIYWLNWTKCLYIYIYIQHDSKILLQTFREGVHKQMFTNVDQLHICPTLILWSFICGTSKPMVYAANIPSINQLY